MNVALAAQDGAVGLCWCCAVLWQLQDEITRVMFGVADREGCDMQDAETKTRASRVKRNTAVTRSRTWDERPGKWPYEIVHHH